MFCGRCGKQINDSERYCTRCGYLVRQEIKTPHKLFKNKKKLWISTIAGILVVATVVVSLCYFIGGTQEDQPLRDIIDAINDRDSEEFWECYPTDCVEILEERISESHEYHSIDDYFSERVKDFGDSLDKNYDYHIDFDVLSTEDVTEEEFPEVPHDDVEIENYAEFFEEYVFDAQYDYFPTVTEVKKLNVRWKITAGGKDITEKYIDIEHDEDNEIQECYIAKVDGEYFVYTALLYNIIRLDEYILNEI